MATLTIRTADGTPIRIPLTALQIRSVEIDGVPVWEKPEPKKPTTTLLTEIEGVNEDQEN